MAHQRHTAAFVVGIALGGLAGAGYVLFKTPRSGRAVRARITARVQTVVDAVKETAGVVGIETRRVGEQAVERIEATGATVRDRLPGVADLVPGSGSSPVAPVEPPAAVASSAPEDDFLAAVPNVAASPAASSLPTGGFDANGAGGVPMDDASGRRAADVFKEPDDAARVGGPGG